MLKLGQMMNDAGIPYIWLYFSQERIPGAPSNMIHMQPTLNVLSYVKSADYLVQMSDSEAFGYSIVEALELGTAVITTPLDVLTELDIQEGIHGYMVPFEVDGFDCQKLLTVPQFEYKYDNKSIIKQWRKLLGNTKPKHNYKPSKNPRVRIIRRYHDMVLGKTLENNTVVEMVPERAELVCNAGYAVRV